jgi:tRNA nucleotidyltransferase/poly(A) polymerase
MKSFKDYIVLREAEEVDKNWKQEYRKLAKGFNPDIHAKELKPVIEAFANSNKIPLTTDTTKDVTMPKKSLFLVGGAVRDFLLGKTPHDYDVATNATPAQIARILDAAGFKAPIKTNEKGETVLDYDRSGKGGKFDLGFTPKAAEPGDKKKWMLTGRDSSKDHKPFVITAVVNGQEFEIATFRRDAKVTEGQAEVDFVDNPIEDAKRRDLTINAMYIELTNSDSENSKLYDPTHQGWHDIRNGVVRAVGPARERFKEDPLRTLRAIRFHCRFGRGWKMHKDIENALPDFKDLEGVALERVKKEFISGLTNKDTDPKCFLSIYDRTGYIEKVFPGVQLNFNVPPQLRDKDDKLLSLAWILQDNPSHKIAEVLGTHRGERLTGWSNQERNAVLFLVNLKYFDPDQLEALLKQRTIAGITKKQIREWVDLFNTTQEGRVKSSMGPKWQADIKKFSGWEPKKEDLVTWMQKKSCPGCEGEGCQHCEYKGFQGEVHPEIVKSGLHMVAPTERSGVVQRINKERLKKQFEKHVPE